jgi:hypothetical protein
MRFVAVVCRAKFYTRRAVSPLKNMRGSALPESIEIKTR